MSEKFILDPTCGGRTIWYEKQHPNVVYGDIRTEEKGLCKERPNFYVKPDVILDYRCLNYPDKKFKLIVWDPPHIDFYKTSIMGKKYGSLGDWQRDLPKGFAELWRVLADYGVLIFKWNEEKIKIKEILELFNQTPLFGHRTGSKSKTMWLCFMKIPEGGD